MGLAGGIDGFAVDGGDGGDVFGGFQAAFDFEAGYAAGDESGDFPDGSEVLRGEEVVFVPEGGGCAVNNQLIRHATSLGALAAVGAALSEGFAGEALAGVGDAEGAMDEDFEGDAGVLKMSEFSQ